jgi:hypothetical protein
MTRAVGAAQTSAGTNKAQVNHPERKPAITHSTMLNHDEPW